MIMKTNQYQDQYEQGTQRLDVEHEQDRLEKVRVLDRHLENRF